jgi:hypothetical protein
LHVELGEGEGFEGRGVGFAGFGGAGAGPCGEGKGRDEDEGRGADAPGVEEGHRGSLRDRRLRCCGRLMLTAVTGEKRGRVVVEWIKGQLFEIGRRISCQDAHP